MTTYNAYDVGDLVRLTGTFTDADGVATDPTAITIRIKTPARVETTYTYGVDAGVERDSTGVYHIDVDITQVGTWFYRWAGTGAVKAAQENVLTVRESAFTL